MADKQDYTEDMAQGDFSNGSYGDSQGQESNLSQDQASNDANPGDGGQQSSFDKHESNGGHAESAEESHSAKDEDRKLFVGGLSWSTTDKDLREYFGKYGEIESVTVKMDPATGRSRGFAFLIFKSAESLDKVFAAGEHTIAGKRIDPKKAKARAGKIFIGGLPQDCTEETIRAFFGQFGRITEVEMPFDRVKNQRKNFCFVTYDNETVVFELLKTPKQVISGKEVDVKKATPKLDTFGAPAGRGGRGAPHGGGRGAPRGRGSWGNWGGQGSYGSGGGSYGAGYGSGYGGSYGYDGYGYDYYGGGYDSYGGYGDYYGGPQGGYSGGKQRGGRQPTRHQPY